MHTQSTPFRLLPALLLAMGTIGLALPGPADAVTAGSQLFLRPHCGAERQEDCPGFAVKDPASMVTPTVLVGQDVDMDVVLRNEGNAGIERVRFWLAYDPNVLQGLEITPAEAFPVTTPGETGFDSGYAKFQAETRSGKASGPLIPLARIRFRLTAVAPAYATILSFNDVTEGTDGHTYVSIARTGQADNLLSPAQSALFIPTQPLEAQASSAAPKASSSSATAQASSAPPSSSAPFEPPPSSAAPAPETAVFTLIQPQNLRVTTEGSTVYLAWDALRSGALGGYHLYYGTRSGEYLQRRAMPAAQTTLVLRNLPVDTTYYFALRGVSANAEETAFSQEVAVKVGSPATSTVPLLGTGMGGGKNPVGGQKPGQTVPGATGFPVGVLLLALAGAGLLTFRAARGRAVTHP